MKYLKKYEGFYNNEFKAMRENFVDESETAVDLSETELKADEDCECEDCDDCKENQEIGKVDESKFRKFFTGHESTGDRDSAMISFHKALDEAEAHVAKAPSKFVFNRESLEKRAESNNYKGGLRIQRGGRDKSRYYVVYDLGTTGFEVIASGAGGERRDSLGM